LIHTFMSLISYSEWKAKYSESSPMTRIRAGLPNQYPMPADVMSRSTPSPEVMKMAIAKFGTPGRKKKSSKKSSKKKKG